MTPCAVRRLAVLALHTFSRLESVAIALYSSLWQNMSEILHLAQDHVAGLR